MKLARGFTITTRLRYLCSTKMVAALLVRLVWDYLSMKVK